MTRKTVRGIPPGQVSVPMEVSVGGRGGLPMVQLHISPEAAACLSGGGSAPQQAPPPAGSVDGRLPGQGPLFAQMCRPNPPPQVCGGGGSRYRNRTPCPPREGGEAYSAHSAEAQGMDARSTRSNHKARHMPGDEGMGGPCAPPPASRRGSVIEEFYQDAAQETPGQGETHPAGQDPRFFSDAAVLHRLGEFITRIPPGRGDAIMLADTYRLMARRLELQAAALEAKQTLRAKEIREAIEAGVLNPAFPPAANPTTEAGTLEQWTAPEPPSGAMAATKAEGAQPAAATIPNDAGQWQNLADNVDAFSAEEQLTLLGIFQEALKRKSGSHPTPAPPPADAITKTEPTPGGDAPPDPAATLQPEQPGLWGKLKTVMRGQ